MGNLLVFSIVLMILCKIVHYLYQQIRTSGTLCTSCTSCILTSSSTNQPDWLRQYRENNLVEKGVL